MTEQQEKILYEIHAAVFNGLRGDMAEVKEWIIRHPDVCYWRIANKRRRFYTKWAIGIIAGMTAIGTFVLRVTGVI